MLLQRNPDWFILSCISGKFDLWKRTRVILGVYLQGRQYTSKLIDDLGSDKRCTRWISMSTNLRFNERASINTNEWSHSRKKGHIATFNSKWIVWSI